MTETEERCESPSMEEAVSDLIGCIAFGCCNRCDDGFDMIKLPVDATRKKKWLDNMKREKWDPPPDVKICEVHFANEMWELDKKTNKRKLKSDALPTLFSCKGDSIPTLPYSQAKKCCAADCSNREGFTSSSDITFHRFPGKNAKAGILEKWKEATGDPSFVPTPKSYLCSEHLDQEDIKVRTDKVVRTYVSSSKVKTEDLEEIDVNDPYIEIHGLDPSKHSDLNSDIRRIADFFGVKVETEHIHRSFIVKKKNKDTGHITSDMVIVKFNDLSKKRELLKAFKNSDNALIDSDKGEAIFLTGELSSANKKLLVITEKIPVGEMKSVKATSGSPSKSQESLSETCQGNIVVKKLVRNIVIEPNEIHSKVTIQKRGKTPTASVSAKEIVDILEDNKDEGLGSTSPPKKEVAQKGKNNQLDQQAIKLKKEIDDSDMTQDDIIYGELMTDAAKSAAKASLKRVKQDEEESIVGEDTTPDRRTKPFKKRFSTENSDEVELEEEEDDNDDEEEDEEEKSPKKKKGRKSVKASGGPPSKESTPQLRSYGGRVSLRSNRRQVVKPKRYREDFFDYSSPVEKKRREMSPQKKEIPVVKDLPVQKKEGPIQKKESPVQKRETPVTRREFTVQKKETPVLVVEVSHKEVPPKKEVPLSKVEKTPVKREMPRRKLTSPVKKEVPEKEPDKDSVDEEEFVEYKEVGRKKRIVKKAVEIKEVKRQTQPKRTLKVVVESESDTDSCVSDTEIKKRAGGRVSTSKSTVGNTSELTPQHGVTPITVNNVVTSLSSGTVPVGLTPINIPQVLNIPPSSQANPNNFKLITNFDQLICHLKERQMLESHLETILVKNFCGQELYKLMRCKDLNPISKFSELQVKFALIMLLYSSKCFKYLDAVFAMPPVTSLENLLITSDFKPGFLEESFNFLADAYDGCGRITLRECFLAVDTIPISKKLVWDHENDTFTGSTKIFESFSYHISEATNILIVMLCSLTNVTSIPIAYFPLDTVHPDFEASIIKIALNKLYERRIKVHGIVLDASETSFACSKILGCSLITEAKISSAHFIKNKTKIPILFDCYHLSRLARDTLAELDVISTSNGCAEWKYIHLLNERLMSKFSSNSKNSGDTLMQLKFNSSLSMALEHQKNEGDMSFSCCQPTLMLIKQIDKVISIFDYTKQHFVPSCSEKSLSQHKSNYLSDFCPYFRSLKTESEILFKHNKYEFVKGLYFTMNSIWLLYDKLRKVVVNKDIPKHRFSLDPVDLFYYYAFSRVNSDHPIDCLAFRQGLAKYVKQVTHKSIPFKEIPPLLVDFRSDKRSFRPYQQVINENKHLFYVEVLTCENLRIYSDNILKLVCHEIIDNLSSKIKCLKCIDMLNNRHDSILPADHNDYTGGLWKKEMSLIYSNRYRSVVSDECLKIIKKTEQIFNIVKLSVNIRDMPVDKLIDIIVAKVKRDLYSGSLSMPFSKFNHPVYEDVATTTHELYLTRLLIEHYIKFRMTKIKIFSSLINKFDTLFIII